MSQVDYDFPEPPNPDIEAQAHRERRVADRLRALGGANAETQNRMAELESSVEGLQGDAGDPEQQNEWLDGRVKTLEGANAKLLEHVETIVDGAIVLSKRIDVLEQASAKLLKRVEVLERLTDPLREAWLQRNYGNELAAIAERNAR